MKHGPASGKTAGQIPAVPFQLLRLAFLPGILVPSDYYGTLILPQIQNTLLPARMIHQVFFQAHIQIGIEASGFYRI